MAERAKPLPSTNRRTTRSMAARERSPEVVLMAEVVKSPGSSEKKPPRRGRRTAKGPTDVGPSKNARRIASSTRDKDPFLATKADETNGGMKAGVVQKTKGGSVLKARDPNTPKPKTTLTSAAIDSSSSSSSSEEEMTEVIVSKKPRRKVVDPAAESKSRAKLATKDRKALENVIRLLVKADFNTMTIQKVANKLGVSKQEIYQLCCPRRPLFVIYQRGEIALNLRKVSVCESYWTDDEHDLYDCEGFHICPDWLLAGQDSNGNDQECPNGNGACNLEHDFLRAPANREAVKIFGFEGLCEKSVRDVLRVIVARLRNAVTLRLCEDYYVDDGQCPDGTSCTFLHLCVSVAIPGRFPCPKEDCSLNHDLREQSCCNIYTMAGITNDIVHVASRKSLTACIAPKLLDDPLVKKIEAFKYKSTAEEDGDVQDAQICLESLVGAGCEKNICYQLHSVVKGVNYQWQVKSERAQGGQPAWLNLPPAMNEEVEEKYCSLEDVELIERQAVDIPKLRELLDESERSKYPTVIDQLGLDEQHGVEFYDGKYQGHRLLTKATNAVVKLRRLGTPSSASCSHPFATKYVWYFPDDFERWVRYGENSQNASGTDHSKSAIDSDTIEAKFAAGQRTASFHAGHDTYVIDFVTMKQQNKKTKKKRQVLRRPWRKPNRNAHPCFPTPVTWAPMKKTQLSALYEVPAGSAEFQEIKAFVDNNGGVPTGVVGWGTHASTAITRVVRIQSPFLWQAYQAKKNGMIGLKNAKGMVPAGVDPMLSLLSAPPMNELRVFHGTKEAYLQSIAKNGIAWQLVARHVFGKGAYFAVEARMAADYSDKPHLIVARILTGSSYENNKTNLSKPVAPFDSTFGYMGGRRERQWKLHVIYDDDMMYPEYIIYF